MKTLSLYIDRWYIAAAVCYDNIPRRIDLPNREDRIWLYFMKILIMIELFMVNLIRSIIWIRSFITMVIYSLKS